MNGRAGCILALALIALLFPRERADAAPATPFRHDRILIIPKAGREAQLDNQHAAERVKVKKKYPALGNIHVLELPPGADPEKTVERYRRNGHVETADLDYMGWQPAAVPNDPYFLDGSQWHLNNTGQFGGLPDADIDAPEAWDILNSASNIVVATIDTGARLTHEDLVPNLWVNPGEIPGDGIDNDGNGYIDDIHGANVLTDSGNPADDHMHGTHVAGIIGAVGNNGVGVSGVAWKVRIMPVKFYYPDVPSDSQVVEALDYARNKGAKIVNFSFVTSTSTAPLTSGFLALQTADITLCAAAGNSGTDNSNPSTPVYPANYKMSNIVAVTATGRGDALWTGPGGVSNYGSNTVHLAAPGANIYSTWYSADSGFFAYNENSGTSMAAPMVAGAAALLRAKFTNESSAQIIQRILNSVDVLPNLVGKCITSGRLNLHKALDTASLPLFGMTNGVFNWVPTNSLMPMTFTTTEGVNGPFALPFAFPFYGRSYTQIWVGINGLLGVTNTGLGMGMNVNIPSTNTPNAIYPYWDDLTTNATGSVWCGTVGDAPNRKCVVSWVAMPHMSSAATLFTFQSILHESGHISFQYAQVNPGANALTNGKSATIGIEDPTGLFAARYAVLSSPFQVTNNQAIVFTPQVVSHPAPGLRVQSGPGGQIQLAISGEPRQPGAVLFSTNLTSWSMIYSNLLPASGLATFVETNAAPQRFYRALSGPFLP